MFVANVCPVLPSLTVMIIVLATFKPKSVRLPSMKVKKIMNMEMFAMKLIENQNEETSNKPDDKSEPKRAAHLKNLLSKESEAVMLKCAELFMEELTVRAYHYTSNDNRKILQDSDIKCAINDSDLYDFLIDKIPRSNLDTPAVNTAFPVVYMMHQYQNAQMMGIQDPQNANSHDEPLPEAGV